MLPLQQLNRAIAARDPLRAGATDALRLLDGAGDGLDGVEIEDFAGRWLVQTRDRAYPEWLRGVTGGEGAARLSNAAPARPSGATAPKSVYWKQLGERKETPVWVEGERAEEPFEAMENGMRFWVDFTAGYSQGIFLDQRENRAEARRRAGAVQGRKTRVLNCFAYTCAFGLAAALGGAETVNVDLSKRYLEWGRRNYELNGIEIEGHDFIYGDARNWMERFAKKGRRFDLVILDPPTFSRDKDGKVFTVESGFADLVSAAEAVLTGRGGMFCSTNQRTLTGEGFRGLIAEGLRDAGKWRMREGKMPGDFTGERYLKSVWVDRAGA